jgi:hypothetical protein
LDNIAKKVKPSKENKDPQNESSQKIGFNHSSHLTKNIELFQNYLIIYW